MKPIHTIRPTENGTLKTGDYNEQEIEATTNKEMIMLLVKKVNKLIGAINWHLINEKDA